MEAAGPGTFESVSLQQGLSFTIGDGWGPIFPEAPELINMQLPGQVVLFVMLSRAESTDDAAVSAASGGLTLENEESVEVGGIAATRYEVAGSGGDSVLVETLFGEFTTNTDGEAVRLTLLEVNGTVVAIAEVGTLDDPASSWAESQKVIDTIVWATT